MKGTEHVDDDGLTVVCSGLKTMFLWHISQSHIATKPWAPQIISAGISIVNF